MFRTSVPIAWLKALSAVAMMLALALTTNAAAMTNYRIVPITGLDKATGLADDGMLGAIAPGTLGSRPVLWKSGVITALPAPQGNSYFSDFPGPGFAISPAGLAAVQWFTDFVGYFTYFYVGGLAVSKSERVVAGISGMNDAGDRVGSSVDTEGNSSLVALAANHIYGLLSPGAGGAIGNDGRIVGSTTFGMASVPGRPVVRAHAFDNAASVPRELVAPGGAVAAGRCTAAAGLNATGSGVGSWSETAPILLPAATALAIYAAVVFAGALLVARLVFVHIPAFTAVGDHHDRTYPRRSVLHNAVIGALFLYGAGCLLALACGILLVDPYLLPVWNASPSNAMRWVVESIPGIAIAYAGHRVLLMLLARKLSADELAAVRATWTAMREESGGG